jgi:alanyl-tRNA synthetase
MLNQILGEYGGRGGGKPNFASGGTPGQVETTALLDQVMLMLEESK